MGTVCVLIVPVCSLEKNIGGQRQTEKRTERDPHRQNNTESLLITCHRQETDKNKHTTLSHTQLIHNEHPYRQRFSSEGQERYLLITPQLLFLSVVNCVKKQAQMALFVQHGLRQRRALINLYYIIITTMYQCSIAKKSFNTTSFQREQLLNNI